MLTKEQENFLKEFSERRTLQRYEKLWGLEYMRRTNTVKGEIDIDLRRIRYIDMGAVAEHCDCGQSIRYVYMYKHKDELFKMGSTCIQHFTGLSGKDVKMIIDGSIETNKERNEVTNTLKVLTFDQWLNSHQLIKLAFDKIDKLDFSDCEHDKEMILNFFKNELPLPRYFTAVLTRKYYNLKRAEEEIERRKREEETELVQNSYTERKKKILEKAEEIIGTPEYDEIYAGPISVIRDILARNKRWGKTSDAQIDFLDKLNKRVEDPRQKQAAKYLSDLTNIFRNVTKKPREIVLISDLKRQLDSVGLSDNQLKLILDESFTTKKGKVMVGLSFRFEKELDEYTQSELQKTDVQSVAEIISEPAVQSVKESVTQSVEEPVVEKIEKLNNIVLEEIEI